MKKIEAASLEVAYALACEELDCSINELKYEIVQYPSKGILGLFAKPAIIVAAVERTSAPAPEPAKERKSEQRPIEKRSEEHPSDNVSKETNVIDEPSVEPAPVSDQETSTDMESESVHDSEAGIIEGFFSDEKAGNKEENEAALLQEEIEGTLKDLIAKSCFDIDVVEVDVIEDTAYIFIDGEDAALLIGKEGYRYNAISYLLYNWIHTRYRLYTKLEIARFLSSQEEMIRKNLQPIIEHVEQEGWGRTRSLDGILVQIALEQLREAFPNKYVAIKRQRDGKRYVLINEFNKKK